MESTTNPIKAIAKPKRKKMSLELIEDFETRQDCYKKKRASLLKKVGELTTLCGVDACAIISGPGDKVPIMWPSDAKTNELVDKFENAPLSDQMRRNVNPRVYMEQKNTKTENQIDKLKEKNHEKGMSVYMCKIYNGGKSVSDFDSSDLSRLLSYVEVKLKGVRERLSPNNLAALPGSCPQQNDVNFWGNLNEKVFDQQFFLDLVQDMNNNGLANNIGSHMNMGLPPLPHLGAVDMGLPQGNFVGLNGNSDSELLYESFGGTIGGSGLMSPLINNSEGNNISGTFMGIGQHHKNQGGSFVGTNNGGNFGANNDGAANFVGTNNRRNLNPGSPSHGNFVSSGW